MWTRLCPHNHDTARPPGLNSLVASLVGWLTSHSSWSGDTRSAGVTADLSLSEFPKARPPSLSLPSLSHPPCHRSSVVLAPHGRFTWYLPHLSWGPPGLLEAKFYSHGKGADRPVPAVGRDVALLPLGSLVCSPVRPEPPLRTRSCLGGYRMGLP